MKLKSFSLSALAAGVVFLAVGLIVPLVKMIGISSDNANVGIIGGADSPTFGFVVFRLMNGWPFCCVLIGVSLILTALFCLVFSKHVKQNCTVKTFIYSLSLSAITALGAVGAALGLIPSFIAEGWADGNSIAVFTAIGMCWSGYLSTHTAMLDSLGYRELTSKAILAHTIGGLVAAIVAHWVVMLYSLI